MLSSSKIFISSSNKKRIYKSLYINSFCKLVIYYIIFYIVHRLSICKNK